MCIKPLVQIWIFLILSASIVCGAENQYTVLKAKRLWDGHSSTLLTPGIIVVHGEKIDAVGFIPKNVSEASIVDLGDVTLMPALMDAHTHLLLQGDPTIESYNEQVLKESIPYRTLRAASAARKALEHGFTTLRDLGTEGAMYADVDLKKSFAQGILDGPRLFVATRALSSTGTYPLLGFSWELQLPSGVQVVDGAEEIRHAVREQVAHGADWIKFYADRNYFIGNDGYIHSWRNFTDEELRVLVEESHARGVQVSAHAIGREGIESALRAGVNSIEHGDGLTDDLMDLMIERGVFWCPTIYVGVYVSEPRAREGRPIYKQMLNLEKQAFRIAIDKKVAIALGSDAGGYPWTENPAQELIYMVQWGMTPEQALLASTETAARLLGLENILGRLAPGYLADIIAVKGNPLENIRSVLSVTYVMKEGRGVYRAHP